MGFPFMVVFWRFFLKDVNSGQTEGINVQLLLLTGKYRRGRNMVETKRPECGEQGADGQTWPFFLSSPPGSPKTYLLQLSEREPTLSLSKNPPSPTLSENPPSPTL